MNEAEKERLIKKDLVSIENRVRHAFNQGYEMGLKESMIFEIKSEYLYPPVTPQPRTGRWIEHFDEIGKWYECDQCHTDWGGSVNYCPHCGAKMEAE